MSQPSIPPDNSLQVEQLRQQEAQKAAEKAAADKKAQEDQLAALRTSSADTARSGAQSYLQQRGVDPTGYASALDQLIQSTLSGISPSDPNPGGSFANFGQTAYNELTQQERDKALRDVNSTFTPDYATTRLPFTLDDPYLSSIEQTQRQSADDIIKNMLARGVITTAGQTAATGELNKQEPGVRTKLQDIGTGVITSGQQKLIDEANQARQAASTLDLGTTFNPGTYTSEADRIYNEFVNSLGDQIKAAVPGDLFSTAGLAAIAGAGQGAQNLKFDPKAAAGIFEDNSKPKSTTSGAGATIF